MNQPTTAQPKKQGADPTRLPCSGLPRLYSGCWRPIKPGRLCRVTRLYKSQPIVTCLGPLDGEANLRGDQYWRVRFADGTEREVARAHLSLKLQVERFTRRVTPNIHQASDAGEAAP